MSDIVPFGKYKGQSVEVMTADQQYVDWLKQQPWFKDKYANVYNTIINYSQEPAETPEHNALQIKFLDPEFQESFVLALFNMEKDERFKFSATINFEVGHPPIDVVIEEARMAKPATEDDAVKRYRDKLDGHKASVISMIEDIQHRYSLNTCSDEELLKMGYYGVSSIPLPLKKECYYDEVMRFARLRIEIKSTIGDDYPAVLRQMQKSGAGILLVGSYTGEGATEAQFKAFFATAKIHVIFLTEIPSPSR